MPDDRKPFDPKVTAFTNMALDEIMPVVSPSAWKVICFAIRKTAGWADPESPSGRKESDVISLSQFMAGCGISRNTAMTAIAECVQAGYLNRTPEGSSFRYSLNLGYNLPDAGAKIEPVQELNWRENRASSGANLEPAITSASAKIAPIVARNSRIQTVKNSNVSAGAENSNTNCNAPQQSAFVAAALRSYENVIGLVSGPVQAQEIGDMLAELEQRGVQAWWDTALQIAADQNARRWAYVRGTLNNCLRDGRPPLNRGSPRAVAQRKRMVKLADGTTVEAIA